MLALLIAALTAASSLSTASPGVSADLSNGCRSVALLMLCRHNGSVELFVAGRPTKLLKGYFADSDTSYVMYRTGGVYHISLGEPGTSTDPMYLSYSIDIARTSNGPRLVRLIDTGEISCNGTGLPYLIITDFRNRTVTYRMRGKTRQRRARFVFPLEAGGVDPFSVSFDDHLTLISRAGKPPDRQLCGAADLN